MFNQLRIELRGAFTATSKDRHAAEESVSPRPVEAVPAPPDADAQIEAVLDTLRPAMEADGGGVDLDEFSDGVVTVRLKGLCLDCPSSEMTLRLGIEKTLKDCLPWVSAVVRVDSGRREEHLS